MKMTSFKSPALKTSCFLSDVWSTLEYFMVAFLLFLFSAEEIPKVPLNPCEPSPCGPNSICQVTHSHPVCSCAPNYIGSPPFCRPECTMSQVRTFYQPYKFILSKFLSKFCNLIEEIDRSIQRSGLSSFLFVCIIYFMITSLKKETALFFL